MYWATLTPNSFAGTQVPDLVQADRQREADDDDDDAHDEQQHGFHGVQRSWRRL